MLLTNGRGSDLSLQKACCPKAILNPVQEDRSKAQCNPTEKVLCATRNLGAERGGAAKREAQDLKPKGPAAAKTPESS